MSKVVEVKEKKEVALNLKPIIRAGWLPKGHDGEFQFTGCETWIVPPKSSTTGQRLTGLTEEDERRLEIKLRMSVGALSRYNEDFWSKYCIKVPKEGKIFFMENPKDELDILVLKAHPSIANSAMEIADSPGASHYLTSVEKEAEVNNVRERVEREAIKKFSPLSAAEMIDILKVYAISGHKMPHKITKATPTDLVETSLYNKLKEDPEEFLRIINDPSFKTKVLIDKFLTNKILLKSGSRYLVHGGDVIGVTLEATIEYLEDPYNQDVLLGLRAKLEAIE